MHAHWLDKYEELEMTAAGGKRERETTGPPCIYQHQIPRKTPYGSARLIAWLHMWKIDKAITAMFMFEE